MLALLALLACAGSDTTDPAPSSPDQPAEAGPPPLQPLRIGWQTTWATQGQLAVILQKTDILESLGFDAEFVGFAYGAPLNEGALAGEVDVIFTADQPAIALMSRAEDWDVIGRLMYNRVGTFVPPDSPVQSPADLKGKTIAIPFGAAAHRETLSALRGAGLDPDEDITAINLGLQELVSMIGAGGWGDKIHAGSAWDPAYADLEHAGRVRTVAQGLVTSVVVMRGDLAEAGNGEGAEKGYGAPDMRVMQALHLAYDWYRTHPDEANQWFIEASKLDFEPAVLELAASVEPNLEAADASGLRVALSDDDLNNMQSAADFMFQVELLKEPFTVAHRVRQEVAQQIPGGAADGVQVKD